MGKTSSYANNLTATQSDLSQMVWKGRKPSDALNLVDVWQLHLIRELMS